MSVVGDTMSMIRIKLWLLGSIIGRLPALPLTAQSDTVGPQPADRLATASPDDSIAVITHLRNQADAVAAARTDLDLDAEHVLEALRPSHGRCAG